MSKRCTYAVFEIVGLAGTDEIEGEFLEKGGVGEVVRGGVHKRNGGLKYVNIYF